MEWSSAVGRTDATLLHNPQNPQAMLDRAVALSQLNEWRPAIRLWEQVRRIIGDRPSLMRNIARGHLRLRNEQTALSIIDALLVRDADDPETWAVRGVAMMQSGRLDEALEALRRCAAHRGLDHPENTLNLSTTLLTLGRWDEGLPLYERRWPHVDASTATIHRHLSTVPAWNPATETEIDLVIGAEQGIGDTIMMARYLPVLARRVRTVTAMAQPPLMALFTRNFAPFSNLRVVPLGEVPLTDSSRYLMSMSILHALNVRPDRIVAPLGYLSAAAWAEHGGRRRSRSRPAVGISWQGSPGHPDDDIRSLPPDLVLSFLKRSPHINFYALSPASLLPLCGTAPSNLHFPVAEGEGLEVTAALMEAMDLVISIDSAPCHLAGALGVPVWTLLRRHADWRWGTSLAEDTPWYGSMALMRQTTMGDWSTILDQVTQGLRHRLG